MAPISNSQVIFNIRVAELLADAGHDVTIVRGQYNPGCTKIKPKSNVKEVRFMALENETDWTELEGAQRRIIFNEVSMFSMDSKDMGDKFMGVMRKGCEGHLKNTRMLEQLRAEKFDVAFTHHYDYCGIGLIHYLNIESWIWLDSGPLFEIIASAIGVPSPPSYVPGIVTDMTDRMTYNQRFKNFVGQLLMTTIAPMLMIKPQTALFREYYGQDFPDLADLAAKCPLVMVNTDELLDFPRPILHKIIYVGGIGMKSPKPLEGDFKKIIDSANKGAVVVSFGSVANSSTMSDEWKRAFLDAFAAFPDVKFIFKYETKDLKSVPNNVLITSWIPQMDLLGHKNVKAFITHGGFNSVLEAVHTATPIITIPLFADQFRNSRLAEKHGFGYYISKSEMSKEKLIDALSHILNDNK
uniref:UDP-glucuronosyltransferase n=1 Tax=Plectus sambesii TaxID=2011161 RepID=A0A914UQG0_9BILA